jgi:HrpA-like RNA helicase
MRAALKALTVLGALELPADHMDNLMRKDGDVFLQKDPTMVNDLGKLLSKIPITPKFGKMLIVAQKYGLL